MMEPAVARRFRMAEGDWFCMDPLCGNINFARRNKCNRCGKVRIIDKQQNDSSHIDCAKAGDTVQKTKLGQEIGKAAAEKSRGLFSADDWQCNKCGNVNWARRQQCNMCNAPKWGEVEERTGYGGGYNDRGVVEYIERNDSDDEYDEFGRKKKKKTQKTDSDSQGENKKAFNKSYEEDGREEDGREDDDDDDDEDGDLSKYDLSDFGGVSTGNEESREVQHGMREEPSKMNQHRLQNCRNKSPNLSSRRNHTRVDEDESDLSKQAESYSSDSSMSSDSSDHTCRVPNEELKRRRNHCQNDNEKFLKALAGSRAGTRAANYSSQRSRSRSRSPLKVRA